jgi:serine/threonine protein kinase
VASTPGLNRYPGIGAPAEPAVLQDRYILQETIGHGGMATVYRALDSVLDRAVAVKLLHPSVCAEPRFVEQFLTMERHVARLFHPNLVRIFDAGTTDQGCFVVMEYVAGGSLRDLLNRGAQLPVPRAVSIVAQVADALELLHRERIIHGDIKPDNVLLDHDGNAKLVDFGIAHLATASGGLPTDSLGGSVPYLAPEQLQDGRADSRSDVYSLGLVAYELLAGRRAFDGENWVAVAAQRLARDPTPLSAVRPDVPPVLDRALGRALARAPGDRFGSAEEFRQALLRVDRQGSAAEVAANVLSPGTSARRSVFTLPKGPPPESGYLRRIMRGEHPASIPILVTLVALDLALLAIIRALLG